tara:strand:+ start:39855 stop:40664 length:810 start_codon:yes stop_codon:yes gene_type:complete
MSFEKSSVEDYWDEASCGEDLYLFGSDKEAYDFHSSKRYQLEGHLIEPLADFKSSKGKTVLEIGVGLGADHQKFAEAGAILSGIDLTDRAIYHTKNRFSLSSLSSNIRKGDAENLDFDDNAFDIIYSWGVLHHSPDTQKAIDEVYRVLKPGGEARIMVYHKWSLVGAMLWIRYGLFLLRPWRSLGFIYSNFLESPGTKAYSKSEAYELFSNYSEVNIRTELGPADLLESDAGQRHRGLILSLAYLIWPRFFVKRYLKNFGLALLVTAKK